MDAKPNHNHVHGVLNVHGPYVDSFGPSVWKIGALLSNCLQF